MVIDLKRIVHSKDYNLLCQKGIRPVLLLFGCFTNLFCTEKVTTGLSLPNLCYVDYAN